MNDVIKYLIKSLSNSSQTLKKKGVLINKPWTLIDENGEIQKLIFKNNYELILSKNGIVKKGSWEYYPEAKSLLIDRVYDKILLNEQFVDENVLILKKDGTSNDFFALSNENTIPDYNIPKYLNKLNNIEFNIKEQKLLGGNIMQIYFAKNSTHLDDYIGHEVRQIDYKYFISNIADGCYLTENKELSYHIENGIIKDVCRNLSVQLKNNHTVEIENGAIGSVYNYKNKRITINGKPVPNTRLTDNNDFIYEIQESKIAKILTVVEYKLKVGYTIKVEQNNLQYISSGDEIIDSYPVFPIPDGKYRIKGQLRKIKVRNSIIQ
jgi:hypothetical protein